MATWTQAKKWLREGKKIRKPLWKENSYWFIDPKENPEKARITFRDGKPGTVFLKQLEDKDWEIWEDPGITPEKLHKWYLEACEQLDPKNFNKKAQKPYSKLNDDQKLIDIYIAEKINEEVKK